MFLTSKSPWWVGVHFLWAASPVLAQQSSVTLSIVPVNGGEVDPGSVIALEVFITVDSDSPYGDPTEPPGIRLKALQVDVPCSLPATPGSTGSIGVLRSGATPGITFDPDGDGVPGPSSGGIPFLFGPEGIGTSNITRCIIAGVRGLTSRDEHVGVGETRYIATLNYFADTCARGTFAATFEGTGTPPTSSDTTRVLETCEPGQGASCFVSLSTLVPDLNVAGEPLPACDDQLWCSPTDVMCDGVCSGYGNPCPEGYCSESLDRCVECLVDNHCPSDDNSCTDERCSPQGECHSIKDDTNSCDDGYFCTYGDRCQDGDCVSTRRRCSGSRPHCEEELERCVECLVSTHCDDGDPCTGDVCSTTQQCEHFSAEEGPCDDGLFCTAEDVICEGLCIGRNAPCESLDAPFCNEALDRCDGCRSAQDCYDRLFCAYGACIDGTCDFEDSTPSCDDGLFCTVEYCDQGRCIDFGDRCTPPRVCDESLNRCVECLKNSDCDDGNECTTDRCDLVTGECRRTPNRKGCDDGLFCTKVDRCQDGQCVGSPRTCPAGHVCDEVHNRCVPAG